MVICMCADYPDLSRGKTSVNQIALFLPKGAANEKKVKRAVALLLATVMVITTTCFATAPEEAMVKSVHSQSKLMHHAFAADDVNTKNTTPGLSGANNAYLSFSVDTEAIYDYTLTYYNDSLSEVGVLLNLLISSAGKKIPLTFNGDVQRIEVSEDLVILRGPLYTTAKIDGVDYKISAGFTNVESDDAISVGLVFTSTDNSFQTLYSFGTPVLTDSQYTNWRNNFPLNADLNIPIESTPLSSRSSFTYVNEDTGSLIVSGIPTTASGIGSTLYVFKDESNDRLMAGVKTACYQLSEDKFSSGGYLASGLYHMKVSFDRVGSKGNIIGFDSVSLPTSGNIRPLNALFGAFASIATLIPAPYGTWASAFFTALNNGNLSGSPRVSFSGITGTETRNAWISLTEMHAVNEVNFDNRMCPIVLSLGRSGSAGNSSWTVTLEVEYEVVLTYAAFYIPVTDAVVNASVYLD